ncbi:hypothetical protein C6499_10545 [Candidatus Poribacteria bacterium]|nr:MAG: hypothetical protein C6499_10545 [Candidatus Poribacteria bacterium]
MKLRTLFFFLPIVLLSVLTLTVTTSDAQDFTRWSLPDGAKARFGKGLANEVAYSPDGIRLEIRAIPETTALLPNYPNPFNPETWIHYHLATDAEVTLTIYDVRGSVVRELTLGHQPVGVYESRGRAAYWDGKNQQGEPIASGVYFYTLSTESARDSVTAGEFTATRKMLIRK